MRRRDVVLALLVVAVWGGNFVAIDEGLADLPPLLFVGVRFLLTAFPAVLIVPPPRVGWRAVLAVGLLMCVGQFGLLFLGMSQGMPAGLASVIMQSQALFTVLFGAVILRELPNRRQMTGLAVAVGGVVIIGVDRGKSVPVTALALLLAASACWGAANVVTRSLGTVQPISLLVYSALVAPLPLAVLSLALEGPSRDLAAVHSVSATDIGCLLYVVIMATFFGFGTWYWLLGQYPSSTVAPFSLLVPITGLSSAWLFLGEQPTLWQVWGSAVALAGVALIVKGTAGATAADNEPVAASATRQRKPSPNPKARSPKPEEKTALRSPRSSS